MVARDRAANRVSVLTPRPSVDSVATCSAALLRCLAVVAALLPGSSWAGSVFLNGVNIDGVTGQKFENCTVDIDAAGNVHITAKGYAVKGSDGSTSTTTPPVAPPPTAGTVPTKHYYLVTEKAAPGMSEYDIELFANAKFVRKFLDEEQHIVMEITKYLVVGPNKLRFLAKKRHEPAGRRSTSPQHYFRMVLGEGDSSGRNVMITKKAIDYKRTALETQDFNDEIVLTAQ